MQFICASRDVTVYHPAPAMSRAATSCFQYLSELEGPSPALPGGIFPQMVSQSGGQGLSIRGGYCLATGHSPATAAAAAAGCGVSAFLCFATGVHSSAFRVVPGALRGFLLFVSLAYLELLTPAN